MKLCRHEQHVFVVGTGRSGTTLVQALLNTNPVWTIRGENGGVVSGFLKSLRLFHEAQEQHGKPADVEPNWPWYGVSLVDVSGIATDLRRLVESRIFLAPKRSRVVGFKEIRWDWGNLAKEVKMFERVFPNTRFVSITREAKAVASSGFWVNRSDAEEIISERQREITRVAEKCADSFFTITYEDLVGDAGVVKEMFDWLQASFDTRAVGKVLSKKLVH